jgi:hypothetical protein
MGGCVARRVETQKKETSWKALAHMVKLSLFLIKHPAYEDTCGTTPTTS